MPDLTDKQRRALFYSEMSFEDRIKNIREGKCYLKKCGRELITVWIDELGEYCDHGPIPKLDAEEQRVDNILKNELG